MNIPYFPGCTLYTKANGLDSSTRASLEAFNIKLEELPEWTCCGTVFPLANDNYIGMVASARILANAAKQGDGRLVTVCSFCFNVLKRVNYAIKNNEEARSKLNNYLEEEYFGETIPVHPLELFRDEVGLAKVREKVNEKFKGKKVACYYGCMLTRPESEIQFDKSENPNIMEDFASAIGAEPVNFSAKTKCCGSYQLLNNYDLVVDRVKDVLNAAKAQGADAIITSCPLCQFNLDWVQNKIVDSEENYSPVPVLYFTQLIALALDISEDNIGLEQNYIDPRPLL